MINPFQSTHSAVPNLRLQPLPLALTSILDVDAGLRMLLRVGRSSVCWARD